MRDHTDRRPFASIGFEAGASVWSTLEHCVEKSRVPWRSAPDGSRTTRLVDGSGAGFSASVTAADDCCALPLLHDAATSVVIPRRIVAGQCPACDVVVADLLGGDDVVVGRLALRFEDLEHTRQVLEVGHPLAVRLCALALTVDVDTADSASSDRDGAVITAPHTTEVALRGQVVEGQLRTNGMSRQVFVRAVVRVGNELIDAAMSRDALADRSLPVGAVIEGRFAMVASVGMSTSPDRADPTAARLPHPLPGRAWQVPGMTTVVPRVASVAVVPDVLSGPRLYASHRRPDGSWWLSRVSAGQRAPDAEVALAEMPSAMQASTGGVAAVIDGQLHLFDPDLAATAVHPWAETEDLVVGLRTVWSLAHVPRTDAPVTGATRLSVRHLRLGLAAGIEPLDETLPDAVYRSDGPAHVSSRPLHRDGRAAVHIVPGESEIKGVMRPVQRLVRCGEHGPAQTTTYHGPPWIRSVQLVAGGELTVTGAGLRADGKDVLTAWAGCSTAWLQAGPHTLATSSDRAGTRVWRWDADRLVPVLQERGAWVSVAPGEDGVWLTVHGLEAQATVLYLIDGSGAAQPRGWLPPGASVQAAWRHLLHVTIESREAVGIASRRLLRRDEFTEEEAVVLRDLVVIPVA